MVTDKEIINNSEDGHFCEECEHCEVAWDQTGFNAPFCGAKHKDWVFRRSYPKCRDANPDGKCPDWKPIEE